MNIFVELAQNFYGVKVPIMKKKNFIYQVVTLLNRRYSIETAIGMALKEIKLTS
ncbi:MAG: hypothetical protein PVH88_10905 [Ignavibacteria bacterium]|jgi:hypothetical protein